MTKKNIIKHISGKALALLLTCALSACVTTGTRTVEVPDRTTDYVLGVGDNLRISVYGEEQITGEYKVDAKGAISLPLIKDVQAAGSTAAELEQAITDKLDPEYLVDPRVSVAVTNYRPIYVLGEVQQPGQYEFAPDMTALQAVASAGGYTYRGNEDTVEITRHVKGALKTFTVDQTTMIKPGDTLVVKRRWF